MVKKGGLRVFARIQSVRSSFTPAQERIAEFLLTNTLEAALLTATELAQQVNVDPATVVRFAQKLGYAGYLELKTELGQFIREKEGSSPTPPGSLGKSLEEAQRLLYNEFSTLWESIDRSELIRVLELLGMPYHLLLLSDGLCSSTARWLAIELQDRGFRIDYPGKDPGSLAESMLSLEDYDRALILEGITPSPTLEHIAQELQRKNVRSVAIIGSTASQVAHHVDSILHLDGIRDRATYPSILQQLLITILYAVRRLQEAYQNNDEPGQIHQGEKTP
jgi:DNA-binding MurR/RpiR family transcriptional regulator